MSSLGSITVNDLLLEFAAKGRLDPNSLQILGSTPNGALVQVRQKPTLKRVKGRMVNVPGDLEQFTVSNLNSAIGTGTVQLPYQGVGQLPVFKGNSFGAATDQIILYTVIIVTSAAAGTRSLKVGGIPVSAKTAGPGTTASLIDNPVPCPNGNQITIVNGDVGDNVYCSYLLIRTGLL